MNARQNKEKLMDLGKTIADLARELQKENTHVTPDSMYTMINNMFLGRAYYPKYAGILKARYKFEFQKPASSRELLRQAA